MTDFRRSHPAKTRKRGSQEKRWANVASSESSLEPTFENFFCSGMPPLDFGRRKIYPGARFEGTLPCFVQSMPIFVHKLPFVFFPFVFYQDKLMFLESPAEDLFHFDLDVATPFAIEASKVDPSQILTRS